MITTCKSLFLLFGSKEQLGLLMCYFVYKVITNKVFKKVTCQLLSWWTPFPQWKHAAAEASNFLNCTPPKLQCRDCLVINRACTVPSLYETQHQREREWRGAGIPSNAPDYRTCLQYSSRRLQSSPHPHTHLQLHLTDKRYFSSKPQKKFGSQSSPLINFPQKGFVILGMKPLYAQAFIFPTSFNEL